MNAVQPVRLRKAREIRGKSLTFRNAMRSDADFILSIRHDPIKSKYISATTEDVSVQKEWLDKYSVANDHAYFIILSNHEAVGTIRIYDCIEDDFCWGSWIISSKAPGHAAIESALMLYEYALDHLKFKKSHFSVHKSNRSVCRFHERFGAVKVCENETEIHYTISEDAINNSRLKYRRYLPEGVAVDYMQSTLP